VAGGVVYHIARSRRRRGDAGLLCQPASSTPANRDCNRDGGDLLPKMSVIYACRELGEQQHADGHRGHRHIGAGSLHGELRSEGRQAGKEGLKPWESATASASFTVKQFEPPTISCSVSPTTIKPAIRHGDGRRGQPAEPSTDLHLHHFRWHDPRQREHRDLLLGGAPTGPVTIVCTVTDDKNRAHRQPSTQTTP